MTQNMLFSSRREEKTSFSSNGPDRHWESPNLIFNGQRGSFPRGKGARARGWPLMLH